MALVLSLVSADVLATRVRAAEIVNSGTCGDQAAWTLTADGTLTISGSGEMENYAKSEDRPWHEYQYEIKKVVVQPGITYVGARAFDSFIFATELSLPNTLTGIGTSAFGFWYALTEFTLPASVTRLGYCILIASDGITSLSVEEGNPAYHSAGNCIIDTDAKVLVAGCGTSVIPDDGSVTSISTYAFAYNKKLKSMAIPFGVTEIADLAFYKCTYLSELSLPDSIIRIGENAFSETFVSNLRIPNKLTRIEPSAFASCHALNTVTIPQSVTTIGAGAFASCNNLRDVYYTGGESDWSDISIGSSNTSLKDAAMHYYFTAPYISKQTASQNVDEGDMARFSVSARGTGLSYQWQYRTSATGAWKNSGAANAKTDTLTVKATAARNGYQYRCVLTDEVGNVLCSRPATLNITASPLAITAQPLNANVVTGKTAKFTVAATGSGLSYQWQYRSSASGNWKNSGAASAKTANFSISGTVARDGYQYRCVVTDAGGNTVTSNAATLRVLGIKTQPKSVTVTNNATAKFSVKATGNGLSYQWQYRTSASGSWKNSGAASATTANFSVKGTTARNGYQYRCKVTDSQGNVVYSNAATLTVTTASAGITVTAQPKDAKVAEGKTAKFSVTATGSGLSYQWQYRSSSTGSWKNSGAASAATANFSIKGTAARDGYQYRCKITDADGNVVYTKAATLTVS